MKIEEKRKRLNNLLKRLEKQQDPQTKYIGSREWANIVYLLEDYGIILDGVETEDFTIHLT